MRNVVSSAVLVEQEVFLSIGTPRPMLFRSGHMAPRTAHNCGPQSRVLVTQTTYVLIDYDVWHPFKKMVTLGSGLTVGVDVDWASTKRGIRWVVCDAPHGGGGGDMTNVVRGVGAAHVKPNRGANHQKPHRWPIQRAHHIQSHSWKSRRCQIRRICKK